MSENQKSKLIPILLVFVTIVVTGWVVGIKIYSEKRQDKIFANQDHNKSADENWKTYHNDKYNYLFTYPTELTINDGKYNQDDVLFKDPSGLTPDVIQISASLFKDPNIFTLDDWIKNYSQETYVKERDIVIDVVPGIIVGVKVGDEVISSNKKIIFINNNILFEISFHESSDPGLALNQVINSFVKNFKLKK